jgi:hypothetical protein
MHFPHAGFAFHFVKIAQMRDIRKKVENFTIKFIKQTTEKKQLI